MARKKLSPAAKTMETAFDPDQLKAAYDVESKFHFWNIARQAILARLIKKHCENADNRSWLEIGCGTGQMMSGLDSAGLSVDGCDIAAVPDELLASERVTTNTNAFDLPEKRRASYEGLLLLDVLEHLPGRSDFLNELWSAFPNADLLIVTVPAREELWSNYDDYYGHFLRYTPAKFEHELRETNWQKKYGRYFFHSLYFPMFLASRVVKNRKTTIQPPTGKLRRFLHRMMAAYCVVEARVLPGFILGTSIFVVLKRADSSAKASR